MGARYVDEIELQELVPAVNDGGDDVDQTKSTSRFPVASVEYIPAREASVLAFVLQVLPTLLLAGLGMLCAGMLLDVVQHWPLFHEVSELFTLVPALLGLKGNLEMTLASRLSTASSLGLFRTRASRESLCVANLLLIQVQAILVGFAAAIFSIVMGVAFHHEFSVRHACLIAGSSVATASLASGILGLVMCALVILSEYLPFNPDNVAVPIAASLGDLVTLTALSGVAEGMFMVMNTQSWFNPLVLVIFLLFVLPAAWSQIRHHPATLSVIHDKWSWLSILAAVMISSVAGLLLERFVKRFAGLAALAPIINGLGGSLGAVLASRIATSLHTGHAERHSRSAVILFALVVPVSVVFLGLVQILHLGHTSITPMFIAGYCAAALLQVSLLLVATLRFLKFLWRHKLDPDNVAIPFVTAFGDLLGTATLVLCFLMLWHIGDRDSDIGD